MVDNDPRPLVTVVIPIYNGENLIVETVNSILNQSYDQIEIICIIDGTKDRSAAILRGIDAQIKVIEQDNHGSAFTRNRGLSLASGEYIVFLDQDDILEAEFISGCVRTMQEYKCLGLAVNGYLIDGKGDILRRMYRFQKPNFKLESLYIRNQIFTPSQMMFHRQKLTEMGGFDLNITNKGAGPEDWDLLIRSVVNDQFIFLDEYLIRYRIHEGNASKQLDNMLESELKVLAKLAHDHEQLHRFQSFRYMQFGYHQGKYNKNTLRGWTALRKAVGLNHLLWINARFYWISAYLCIQGIKSQFIGGRSI